MMVEKKSGTIFNISSGGGLKYLFNAVYGIGKCALDRMTQDTAVELREHNVAVVGIWPGAVKTEAIQDMKDDEMFEQNRARGESTDFVGKAITHLVAGEPNMIKRTGRVLFTLDLAKEFKFREDDGKLPFDVFGVKAAFEMNGNTWLAAVTPGSMKMPRSMLYMAGFKF